MAGKIFPQTYNCYYCKVGLREGEVITKILKKDGVGKTKLLVCKKCNETILRNK